VPKLGSRSWISLLRNFGVRGHEDLAFPLNVGVTAVIDADRYDPNPHFVIALRIGSQAGERAVFELAAIDVALWIPKLSVTTTAAAMNLVTDTAAPTASPGPGLGFQGTVPAASHGTLPRFAAVGFTTAAVPATTNLLDLPIDLGPFALRPGMKLQLQSNTVNAVQDVLVVVEELGFE